jgi:23S rRNA (uracil1939-C5)-methyltransferase
MHCDLSGHCSGCTWIHKPYSTQLEDKKIAFINAWKKCLPGEDCESFTVHSIGEGGFRERVDLGYRRYGNQLRLGLYDVDHKEIVQLGICPQMTDGLQTWFSEFISNPPPIDFGSIRLRVSPEGKRGVWIDFSNIDIKKILGQKDWLNWLRERSVVEIGQKRKRLIDRGLGPQEMENWLPTYFQNKSIPLYSSIGTFTQVGSLANQRIVREFEKALPEKLSGRWVELGSGIGNFTLPLAKSGAFVDAVEIDPFAIRALARSVNEQGIANSIHVQKLSFQHPSQTLADLLSGAEGILADPPRSGIQRLTEVLGAMPRNEIPRHFVYISCALESFINDVSGLYQLGYRMRSVVGVDPFPQTPHMEIIGRMECRV